MSTEKGQKKLEEWKELAERAKGTSLEGAAEKDEIPILEGLEASIEEHKDYFEITLPCEVIVGSVNYHLEISCKTNARKVAASVGNFFDAVASHLDYKNGQRLEFKIRLPKPST